jgi:hypothetical protein
MCASGTQPEWRRAMSLRALRCSLGLLLLGALAVTSGCAAVGEDAAGSGDDLTSVTARARELEFVGTLYVDPGTSDDAIVRQAMAQAQTAFGPLRTTGMAVNTRELRSVDAATFVKRDVKVIDPAGGAAQEMTEVKYTYRDDAVVSLEYKDRTSAPLAIMRPDYAAQTDRILTECTANDAEAREFASSIWYVFEPRLEQCQDAIRAEQAKIDADRAHLAHPRTEVTKSEAERLYIPITARLGADKTNQGNSYPEYQRLFAGGVQPDKLVVSLVFGLIDHDGTGGPEMDTNWNELMSAFDTIMQARGDFTQVPGPDEVDLSSFRLSSGKVVEAASFADLVRVHTAGGSRLGLSWDEKKELEKQFAERVAGKWVAVERPVKVQIGSQPARDFAVQLLFNFGVSSFGSGPYRFATKHSDVFIYNGHSSIGYGPLDPKNFTADDFPSSYQLMWIDGCVSYNYYEKDYIPLKEGGTKNLDLVTNGVEAPAWRSGYANGKFLAALLGGQASYRDLLLAAEDTEALRVVDGELDNVYSPTKSSMKVTITDR